MNAMTFKVTAEKLKSCNGEDEEEEKQDDNGVSQEGEGTQEGLNDTFQALNTLDGTQRPQDSESTEATEVDVCALDKELDVTDNDDNEINQIPAVTQV